MRRDARANRDRILSAADALFARHGLTVSLDEIARQAGLGPGTLHRHFSTKDRLIVAVALEHLEALVAAAERRALADDPVAALRDQLTQMITAGDQHAPLKQALAGSPADVAWSQTDVSRRLRDALGELLRRAQQAGAARPDLSADDLIALIAGAYATIQRAGIPASSPHGRRLTSITLGGIGLVHGAAAPTTGNRGTDRPGGTPDDATPGPVAGGGPAAMHREHTCTDPEPSSDAHASARAGG